MFRLKVSVLVLCFFFCCNPPHRGLEVTSCSWLAPRPLIYFLSTPQRTEQTDMHDHLRLILSHLTDIHDSNYKTNQPDSLELIYFFSFAYLLYQVILFRGQVNGVELYLSRREENYYKKKK